MAAGTITYEEWVQSAEFVALEDGNLAYVHKGAGFPVLMLHFNGGESWWFSRVIDRFAQHFSVYAIDLPGCGQSEVPLLPYRVSDMGNCLIEFMNKVGIDRAHYVGAHGGAAYSVEVAVTRPTRVARLVLDGHGNTTRSENKILFRDVIRKTWMDENEFMVPTSQWSGIGEGGFDYFPSLKGTPEHDACMQRISDGWMRHRKWTASLAREGATHDDFIALPQVQAATLCIYGEGDWTNQAVGEGQAPLPRLRNGLTGTQTAIIPNAGLVPAFEQPDAWSALVLDFLLKVG